MRVKEIGMAHKNMFDMPIYWRHWDDSTTIEGMHFENRTKDEVVLENPFLPSGLVIQKWSSMMTYQMERKQPDLPLLKRGRAYQIKANLRTEPANSVLFRLNFYDRFQNQIDSQILRPSNPFFQYPTNAYCYEIELLSAGFQALTFHSFSILPKDEKDLGSIQKKNSEADFLLMNPVDGSSDLTLVFMEARADHRYAVKDNLLRRMKNVMFLHHTKTDLDYYLSEEFSQALDRRLNDLKEIYDFRRFRLVGYGPISNYAALYSMNKFPDATVFVTSDFYRDEEYRRLFENQKFVSLFNRLPQSSVRVYGKPIKQDQLTSEILLAQSLFDYSDQLSLLPFLEEESHGKRE